MKEKPAYIKTSLVYHHKKKKINIEMTKNCEI